MTVTAGARTLVLAIASVLVALLIAGASVGWYFWSQERKVERSSADVDANRDVLITVCSSLTTVRFVFEQLEVLDRHQARNPQIPRSVRADIRTRAALYATAVLALSNTASCKEIE